MQLVLVTSEIGPANEQSLVAELFAAGMWRLHLRKPGWSVAQLTGFLDGLQENLRGSVVVHSSLQAAMELWSSGYKIAGVHLKDGGWQKEAVSAAFVRGSLGSLGVSASVHDPQVLVSVEQVVLDRLQYFFLGPFAPSISKAGYGAQVNFSSSAVNFTQLPAKVFAVGGVTEDNIALAAQLGFQGVALCGALWNDKQPLRYFERVSKRCQQL